MYSVKPIIKCQNEIILPDCMYKVKSLEAEELFFENGTHANEICKSSNVSKNELDMEKLEANQKEVLEHLSQLKFQMLSMREAFQKVSKEYVAHSNSLDIGKKEFESVVVLANPSQIPYSLLAIQKFCIQKNVKLEISSYLHSSVTDTSSELEGFIKSLTLPCFVDKCTLPLILVWINDVSAPELVVGPVLSYTVKGEVNILRYLSRIVPGVIEKDCDLNDLDLVLDICYRLSNVRSQKEGQAFIRSLNTKLGKNTWICNTKRLTLADLAVSSALKQLKNGNDLTPNLVKLLQRYADMGYC